MARISSNVQDYGLNYLLERRAIADNVVLHICSVEPTDYGSTMANSLGNKVNPSVGALTNGMPNGRQLEFSAISDGVGTGAGTATHWALVSINGTELLACQSLAGAVAVTATGTFTLTSFTIRIPDPA